jgi:hypothetical protein
MAYQGIKDMENQVIKQQLILNKLFNTHQPVILYFIHTYIK